jgi:hypothetical protein
MAAVDARLGGDRDIGAGLATRFATPGVRLAAPSVPVAVM